MQEHGENTAEFDAPVETPPESWLEGLRAKLASGSRHLVCQIEGGEVLDFEIGEGWTRIGRSMTADIRLDDPSVSRRHALVVSERHNKKTKNENKKQNKSKAARNESGPPVAAVPQGRGHL
jgi:hypothetical protein